jgi:hypothetical protein
MANSPRLYETGPWEELDPDLEALCVTAPQDEAEQVKRALGLQMVSMRLQPQLISNLKKIADYYGIGYQPMIRDLLNRFAISEIRQILQAQMDEVCKAAQREEEDSTEPVSQFLERERKRA